MQLNQISADMDETELETIIKDAIKSKTGLDVSTVTFNIGVKSSGFGMHEHDVHYFKGATIKFEPGQDIKAVL